MAGSTNASRLRRLRRVGWLAVASMLGVALLAPAAAPAIAAGSFNGAIWTSLSNGATVNANIYANKSDVYLNGGPQNCGSNGLPDGNYYFQVTDPSGATLLSSDSFTARQVKVVGGYIDGVSGAGNHLVGSQGSDCPHGHPVRLMPYDDTPNNGGEYSVDLFPKADIDACFAALQGVAADELNMRVCDAPSKNDNFKVGATTTTTSSTTSTTTTTTSSSTTSTTTPSQSVLSETGTPTVTLPPTDVTGGVTGPAGSGWRLMLIAMAGLLASVLVLSPVRTSTRRR